MNTKYFSFILLESPPAAPGVPGLPAGPPVVPKGPDGKPEKGPDGKVVTPTGPDGKPEGEKDSEGNSTPPDSGKLFFKMNMFRLNTLHFYFIHDTKI